jgi:hypothetical protein
MAPYVLFFFSFVRALLVGNIHTKHQRADFFFSAFFSQQDVSGSVFLFLFLFCFWGAKEYIFFFE